MDEFLERMRKSGNVYLSCAAAGIPRRTAYRWRDKWATFAEKWDEAKDDAVDKLDAEAWKRATDGASDRLLMFLLKAHKPEVYSPVQRMSHEGIGENGAIEVSVTTSPRDEIARRLAGIEARERTDGDPQ